MLHLLLNFYLFPIFGMMFAAASSVGDMGGGGDAGISSGGDEGGAGDSFGGDDEGGDEGGDSADEDEVDSGERSDGGAGEEGNDADPNALVDLGNGRRIAAKQKKLIELAKKAGMEKEAKRFVFAEQRLLKVLPGGIGEAIQLARDVESFGGLDGVRELQSQLQTRNAESQLFESGDPKYTANAFSEAPEAAIKHVVHALNYMQEHHQENFDHIVAKYIMADLGENSNINGVYTFLAGMKDNPEAQKLAKELASYYNSRNKIAKEAPEKKADAKDKALTEREERAKKTEMAGREAQAKAEIKPAMQNAIGSAIRNEGKARGLDLVKLQKQYPGEYFDLASKIHAEINRLAMKDTRFLDNYFADLTKGDVARAARRANQKHAEIIPDAVRAIFDKSGVFKGKKGAPGADKGRGNANVNNGAASQGFTRVSAAKFNAELRSQIDFSKSPQKMRTDGKYILLDGRKIEVVY